MRLLVAFLFVLISSVSLAGGLYPNKDLTPGAKLPVAQADVCKDHYTAKVRNVPQSERVRVFKEYGITDPKTYGRYEVDHFVSLELGGSNDIKNLWPQPYTIKDAKGRLMGARQKDVVETWLHRQVCKGAMSLRDARKAITTDWVAEYYKIKGLK